MVITGLLVKTKPGEGRTIAKQLEGIKGLSIHGVFEEHKVVTVLETDSIGEAHAITNDKIISLKGVTAAYPAYINWDET